MAKQKILTAARLREYLIYDPETGEFLRRPYPVGNKQGKNKRSGWVAIWVDQKTYQAHRLAWMMMTGDFPPRGLVIDHIDGDPFNNRWSNLRLATPAQNQWNRTRVNKNSPTGLTGAYYNKNTKSWWSSIGNKRLGTFPTAEAAHEAYVEAAQQKYGEFLAERLK